MSLRWHKTTIYEKPNKALTKRFGKNCISIYRDDGLAIIPNANGPKSEKARKDVTKLLKNHNLKITSECNLHTANFLDVTFDLNNNMYCAHKKPNSYSLYIDKNSNHPWDPSVELRPPK